MINVAALFVGLLMVLLICEVGKAVDLNAKAGATGLSRLYWGVAAFGLSWAAGLTVCRLVMGVIDHATPY